MTPKAGDIPKLGGRIGDLVEKQLSKACHICLLDFSALLVPCLSLLDLPTLTGPVGPKPPLAHRTCSHSATSRLILFIRLTLSLRTCTAWFGWRLACGGEAHRPVSAGLAPIETSTYQHRRVLGSRQVVHCSSAQVRSCSSYLWRVQIHSIRASLSPMTIFGAFFFPM
jgi:hypothetical protein